MFILNTFSVLHNDKTLFNLQSWRNVDAALELNMWNVKDPPSPWTMLVDHCNIGVKLFSDELFVCLLLHDTHDTVAS